MLCKMSYYLELHQQSQEEAVNICLCSNNNLKFNNDDDDDDDNNNNINKNKDKIIIVIFNQFKQNLQVKEMYYVPVCLICCIYQHHVWKYLPCLQ